MANDSLIRWKRGDYISLGKAIASFNKKITELEKLEEDVSIPPKINYQAIKEDIKTRRELNRYIKSLKRFQAEGSSDIYENEVGQRITKWERDELLNRRKIAENRLKKELEGLQLARERGTSSREYRMGSETFRSVKATLESFKKLETAKGYEFEKIKRRILDYGTYDYEMRKSIVFKENFLNSLYNLAETDSAFQKVYDYFAKIKNPLRFYEITRRSNVLEDFFQWYQNPNDYLATMSSDELADYIISEYQI